MFGNVGPMELALVFILLASVSFVMAGWGRARKLKEEQRQRQRRAEIEELKGFLQEEFQKVRDTLASRG